MKRTVTIPIETYKCLRGHLEQANEIFKSLGMVGSVKAPKPTPKEIKTQKIEKYKKLIATGKRVKKPEHLKKITSCKRHLKP